MMHYKISGVSCTWKKCYPPLKYMLLSTFINFKEWELMSSFYYIKHILNIGRSLCFKALIFNFQNPDEVWEYFHLKLFFLKLGLWEYNFHRVLVFPVISVQFWDFNYDMQSCDHHHYQGIGVPAPPKISLCLVVNSSPLLASGNLWSIFCSYYFAFSRVSYKLNNHGVWLLSLKQYSFEIHPHCCMYE